MVQAIRQQLHALWSNSLDIASSCDGKGKNAAILISCSDARTLKVMRGIVGVVDADIEHLASLKKDDLSLPKPMLAKNYRNDLSKARQAFART